MNFLATRDAPHIDPGTVRRRVKIHQQGVLFLGQVAKSTRLVKKTEIKAVLRREAHFKGSGGEVVGHKSDGVQGGMWIDATIEVDGIQGGYAIGNRINAVIVIDKCISIDP